MKLIVGYNGRGKTPAERLTEYDKLSDKGGFVTFWTKEGRILFIHGSKTKKDAYISLQKMKNSINFSNIRYIVTCYPRYMKKFIKEENIDIKAAEFLFHNYRGITINSYIGLTNGILLLGVGKNYRKAIKEQMAVIKMYESHYKTTLEIL